MRTLWPLILPLAGALGCGVASGTGAGAGADVATVVDTGGGGDAGADGHAGGGVDVASDAEGGDALGAGDSAGGGAEDGSPPAVCGNGRVERGEACDDGNNFPSDGCNPICTSNERCGNGLVDAAEQCDDGNFLNGDGCDQRCRTESGCGNGVVDVGEQCDDGDTLNGDGCSSGCVREVFEAVDTDGDTLSDFDEGNGFVDTDADGVADALDDDSDGDGVPDAVEAGDLDMGSEPSDTDGDGVYDFRDRDSDGDTILDMVEGYADVDGDGRPNFTDTDSDEDYVPDIAETTADTDGDGLSDYVDTDSDNDGVLDAHELFADSDGDGRPNRLDTDSDDDGAPDADESGDADPETYPVDTDGDGRPDAIDTDSDDDGLGDATELGCAAGSSERRAADSDGDGYSDLAEVLVGAPACARTTATEFRRFTDFFFILPFEDPAETAPLQFATEIVKADVHINIDSSGSMDGEIDNVRSRMSSLIVPRVRDEIGDVGFGFSDYRDCRGHAFRLRQRITTNVSAVQSAINGLTDTSGGSEPGYSALWHIGNGGASGSCLDIAAFNPSAGRVAGVSDGTIGGVGYRNGAFPIVIHITDEASQDAECGGCARNQDQAVAALNAIQARMIGVASESPPRDQLRALARRTGATVPTCAWDGARPAGCGGSQCCTGQNGTGQASESGTCPLVFDISNSGNGLAESVVTGIVALVNTSTLQVTTRLRRDDDEYLASGVDTRCFIQRIATNRAVGRTSCSAAAVPADLSPVDGVNDAFRNVTPGTSLYFDVTARNICVEQTDEPQAFFAYIDVVGDGITVLDTQSVTIIVPARTDVVSSVP